MNNLKLYKKIFDVMNETSSLEKEMTVGKGQNAYRAISEAAVLNEIKPLLKKHKLILFPVESNIEEHSTQYPDQYDSSKTKTRLISQIVAKYKIVDIESGEFEILATVGNGADPQDKGSGKAWTYAYKALLQKTFMLFSGEDTDNTHSDEVMPTSNTSDVKITTEQLKLAMTKKGVTESQIFATYKKDTDKSCSDLKFISQEYKQKYFNMCK